MSTYMELSKSAQDQILATIEQSQQLALAGAELWAASVAPVAKGAKLTVPFEAPAPKEVVANSFGFAEQLLASQKSFAEKVVATFAAPKSQ